MKTDSQVERNRPAVITIVCQGILLGHYVILSYLTVGLSYRVYQNLLF